MTMHEGHRARMRDRFRVEGLEGFAPHEVLELVLFYARARGDVNPLAHTLLERFGSLHGVLEANVEQLTAVPGVGEETATLLSLMLPLFRRYSLSVCEERKRIRNRSEAADYCLSLLSGLRTEHFYLLSLSADMRLLGRRLIAEGTLTEVSAYPRLVVQAALEHNAHSVVLCHNHPGGSLRPSTDDVTATLRLQETLQSIDITLLDHIIVAGGQTYSMVQHGDMDHETLLQTLARAEETPRAADSTGRLLPTVKRRKKGPPGEA